MAAKFMCPIKVRGGVLRMFRMKKFSGIPAELRKTRLCLTKPLAKDLKLGERTTLGKFIDRAAVYQEPRIVCWRKFPVKHGELQIPESASKALGIGKKAGFNEINGNITMYQKLSRSKYLLMSPFRASSFAMRESYIGGAVGLGLSAILMMAFVSYPEAGTLSEDVARFSVVCGLLIVSGVAIVHSLHDIYVNIPKSRQFYNWLQKTTGRRPVSF